MTLYERFQQLNLDFAAVGLLSGNTGIRYFCTPKGAEIIGRAGVDGIHYCFVEGFGEMVFAVSPMELPGHYVRPVARSFEDFLRLLLACGSADVIEQAYLRNREQFDMDVYESGFLEDDMAAAFDTLKTELDLTPMQEPFGYIKELQVSFDYSSIPYTEEYTDWGPEEPDWKQRRPAPEWKVYFDAGFWTHTGRDRPGKEILVNAEFTWGGKRWYIPAIYCCAAGVVIDFCKEIEPEEVRAFLDKWRLKTDGPGLSTEERMQLEAEHPQQMNFSAGMTLNGKTMCQKRGSGLAWTPEDCLPEGEHNSQETLWVLKHYRLDPSKGWAVSRCALPWAARRKPPLKNFQLHLEQSPRPEIPGPHFTEPKVGETIPFTHPLTGVEHTLTVLEYERAEFDPSHIQDNEWEYPTHYTGMRYTVVPELTGEQFSVQDCARGDSPRLKNAPDSSHAIMLVGFTHTATANAPRTACSSLYFEPVERVEWRMIFREKTLDDIDVAIFLDESNAKA